MTSLAPRSRSALSPSSADVVSLADLSQPRLGIYSAPARPRRMSTCSEMTLLGRWRALQAFVTGAGGRSTSATRSKGRVGLQTTRIGAPSRCRDVLDHCDVHLAY